jgi:hypothetical protein
MTLHSTLMVTPHDLMTAVQSMSKHFVAVAYFELKFSLIHLVLLLTTIVVVAVDHLNCLKEHTMLVEMINKREEGERI